MITLHYRPFILSLILVICCLLSQHVSAKRNDDLAQIDEFKKKNDIESLVKLYNTSKDNKDYIYHCLFNKVDFKKVSYDNLVYCKKICNDKNLYAGFDIVLEEHEDRLRNELMNKSLDDVIKYYFEHKDHQFVADFVEGRLLSEISTEEQYNKYRKVIGDVLGDSVMYRIKQSLFTRTMTNLSIDSLLLFYNEQAGDKTIVAGYINEIIDSISVSSNYSYSDIKYLDYLFRNSEFSPRIHSVRLKMKEQYADSITKQIDSFLKAELDMVDYYTYSSKYEALEYVADKHIKLLEEINKEKLPEEESKIKETVNKAVAKTYHNYNKLNSIINDSIKNFYAEINNARIEYISSLFVDTSQVETCPILDTTNITYYKFSVRYSYKDLYAVSEIQNSINWIGWTITGAGAIASFLTGGLALPIVVATEVVVAGADIGYDLYKENADDNEIAKLYKRFLNSFQRAMNAAITTNVENKAQDLRTQIIKSQQEFKNKCYELY